MTDDELKLAEVTPRPILSTISVLIPTLGRDLLAGCLLSIAQGSAWPACLIVVDQSASEKVGRWLTTLSKRGLDTRHVRSSQRGVAAGRNRGLELLATPFVAITDDDCRVAPDWLLHFTRQLERSPETILTGRVEPGGDGVVVSVITSTRPALYTRPQLRGEMLYAGNMACALKIFDQVGYFDERDFLRSAEDNDWAYRALKGGISIRYVPGARVTHLDWRDTAQLANTARAYARSQGGVYGKYLRRGDWFMALRTVLALVRALRRWLEGQVRRDQDRIDRGKAILLELFPGIVAGWRAEAGS